MEMHALMDLLCAMKQSCKLPKSSALRFTGQHSTHQGDIPHFMFVGSSTQRPATA
jgi:hypothetical protein